MDSDNRLDSQSALAYIQTLQGIINRMAANSASCKTWCITICAAVLALASIKTGQKQSLCLGLSILFLLLDSYYLGLERRFIKIQNDFVKQKNNEKPFIIPSSKKCEQLSGMLRGLFSFSTTPFYVIIILLLFLFL